MSMNLTQAQIDFALGVPSAGAREVQAEIQDAAAGHTHRNNVTGQPVTVWHDGGQYVIFTSADGRSRQDISMDVDEFNSTHSPIGGQ